jgi:hypothetical protein
MEPTEWETKSKPSAATLKNQIKRSAGAWLGNSTEMKIMQPQKMVDELGSEQEMKTEMQERAGPRVLGRGPKILSEKRKS